MVGVAGSGRGVLFLHGRAGHGLQQPPRHDLEGRGSQIAPEHAGDHRRRYPALAHLLIEARHPAGVAVLVRGGQDGWLVQGQLADARPDPGRFQGDQAPDADREHLAGPGPGQDGLQVLDLGAQAVAGPVRAGPPAAPAVRQIHGEVIGQLQCELGVAAGRLVAPVQDHHRRAVAGPQVADRRPVRGRHGTGGHGRGAQLSCVTGIHRSLLQVIGSFPRPVAARRGIAPTGPSSRCRGHSSAR